MRSFDSLSEREVLALAISLEEEDERVYAEYAEGLRDTFPASAAVFEGMQQEESGHRRRLIELFSSKFGEPHSADPPVGRERFRASETGLAGAPAGTRHRPQPGRHHGSGEPPFLRKSCRPRAGSGRTPATG